MLLRSRLTLLLTVLLLGGLPGLRAQDYSQIIVFGDSLSDTGNDAEVADDKYGIRVPGNEANYTDGRFTSGKDTDPASTVYGGIWHEQLAKIFLGLPAVTASRDGGLNYAYGGATTDDGDRDLNFAEISEFDLSIGITVDNMGKQIDDYLSNHEADAAALYIVWGGANDLLSDPDNTDAELFTIGKQAAKREVALIERLARAGAVNFLVPNLPPIGNAPRFNGNGDDLAGYNAACEVFGRKLNKGIRKLTESLAAEGITVNIKQLDVYGLFGRLLATQAAYNFYNIADSAQGESTKADNYLFWDDLHPTAAGHYQLAVEAYTALTGRPIVQVAPNFKASGFYITRSGVDLSAKLKVPYTVSGTAVTGTDYKELKGSKTIRPDNYTVQLKTPAFDPASAKGKTVLLDIADGGDDFGVGTVTTARIEYGNPIEP